MYKSYGGYQWKEEDVEWDKAENHGCTINKWKCCRGGVFGKTQLEYHLSGCLLISTLRLH